MFCSDPEMNLKSAFEKDCITQISKRSQNTAESKQRHLIPAQFHC